MHISKQHRRYRSSGGTCICYYELLPWLVHDNSMTWKRFPHYWPLEIHRWTSPQRANDTELCCFPMYLICTLVCFNVIWYRSMYLYPLDITRESWLYQLNNWAQDYLVDLKYYMNFENKSRIICHLQWIIHDFLRDCNQIMTMKFNECPFLIGFLLR